MTADRPSSAPPLAGRTFQGSCSLKRRGLGAVLGLSLIVGLAACAADEEPEYIERPVEDLYNQAVDHLNAEEFEDAARAFDEVERQHPYSVWATKAQLMAAYALYEDGAYEDAVVALGRFIDLHPGNRDIAYAYYLQALCYYEQIADVRRDQRLTRDALANLKEVVRRFPDSPYARDARLKIDLARDHLAGKEMTIGRYYLRKQQYLAAINRFTQVIDTFDQTTHVPEALYRLVEINTILGLADEAQRIAAVLGHNFPGSDWYSDAYALVTGDTSVAPSRDSDWTDALFDWL